MTIKDFYYQSEGRTVRVEAESFEQITEPAVYGDCDLRHSVRWSWEARGRYGWRSFISNYFSGYPPFTFDLVNPYWPDKDGNTSDRPKCGVYYQAKQPDGSFITSHTGYAQYTFLTRNRNGATGWLRYCVSGSAPSTGASHPSGGFGELVNTGGGDGSNQKCGVSYSTACPSSGGACQTNFYRNGIIIYSLDECPEISEGQPPDDECNRCCTSLLPLLRSIRL